MGEAGFGGGALIPRFDPKAKGWRGADGRFMKLGVPVNGWVLVRCEGCGQPFPTKAWHPSDRERADHYFCSQKCYGGPDVVVGALQETRRS